MKQTSNLRNRIFHTYEKKKYNPEKMRNTHTSSTTTKSFSASRHSIDHNTGVSPKDPCQGDGRNLPRQT